MFKNLPTIENCEGGCRVGICPWRQCRLQCKIFASGVNLSIFTHFFVFFLTKSVEIRWNWRCKIFGLKIRWCKIFDKSHVCLLLGLLFGKQFGRMFWTRPNCQRLFEKRQDKVCKQIKPRLDCLTPQWERNQIKVGLRGGYKPNCILDWTIYDCSWNGSSHT